jgi:hypothetical protein
MLRLIADIKAMMATNMRLRGKITAEFMHFASTMTPAVVGIGLRPIPKCIGVLALISLAIVITVGYRQT